MINFETMLLKFKQLSSNDVRRKIYDKHDWVVDERHIT